MKLRKKADSAQKAEKIEAQTEKPDENTEKRQKS